MERKEIHSERKFEFAGPTVTMNNIERELRRVITKARLITSATSLPLYPPHLKDRQLSLHIKQDGALIPSIKRIPGFFVPKTLPPIKLNRTNFCVNWFYLLFSVVSIFLNYAELIYFVYMFLITRLSV